MRTREHTYCTVGPRGRTLHIIDRHFPDRTVCGQSGDIRVRAKLGDLLGPNTKPLCRLCDRMRDATTV